MRVLALARRVGRRSRGVDIQGARLAIRKAAESGRYDAVIAAGGDGTIRQVAATLIGTDMPLGIIPVGTGNVLAHEIGLARTPAVASRACSKGRSPRSPAPRPTASRSC